MTTLEIRDLHVSVGTTQILNGITLTIKSGEVHAVMGPNGAGKSTLSAAIMGKPGYTVTSGSSPSPGALPSMPWGSTISAPKSSPSFPM